ncbi:MAG: LamG domain-containing protein, partial [Marinilabiliales bacterium]|nr:LamG domain-containing protein [Marinilabiliales bacterium]
MAYFPFDGNAQDESGHGNQGLISGATPVSDRNGKANGAYLLDGTSSFIQVNNSPSLNLKAYSIAIWVNAQRYCSVQYKPMAILSKGIFPDLQYLLAAYCDYHFVVGSNHKGSFKQASASKNFMINNWYLLVSTYDGKSLKLFINGELAAENECTNLHINDEPLFIGKTQKYNNWFFSGMVDDLRIYNRVISQPEIEALFFGISEQEGHLGDSPSPNLKTDLMAMNSNSDQTRADAQYHLQPMKYCTEYSGPIDSSGTKLALKKVDTKEGEIHINIDLDQNFLVTAKVFANSIKRSLFEFHEESKHTEMNKYGAEILDRQLLFKLKRFNTADDLLYQKPTNFSKPVDLYLRYLNDTLLLALDNVVVLKKKKSTENISLHFRNKSNNEPLFVDNLQVNRIIGGGAGKETGQSVSKTERWRMLDAYNHTFEFEFVADYILARHGDRQFRLNETSPHTYKGKETGPSNEDMSNYSFFKDETYPQKRSTEYILTYTSPFKMNLFIEQTYINWVLTRSVDNLTLVKDLKEENDKAVDQLKEVGILYRTEFKYGKIGTDYVPAYTSTYNAGQKFQINGMDVQIVDNKERVVKGGYDKDINGYTAVYQLINQSSKNYLISFHIGGTSKMTDIVKNGSFFSFREYKTDINFSDFSFTKTILLKPNESFKNQLIV